MSGRTEVSVTQASLNLHLSQVFLGTLIWFLPVCTHLIRARFQGAVRWAPIVGAPVCARSYTDSPAASLCFSFNTCCHKLGKKLPELRLLLRFRLALLCNFSRARLYYRRNVGHQVKISHFSNFWTGSLEQNESRSLLIRIIVQALKYGDKTYVYYRNFSYTRMTKEYDQGCVYTKYLKDDKPGMVFTEVYDTQTDYKSR